MKFCIISQNHISESTGGAELQCQYIAKELVTREYNIYYIFMSKNRISPYRDSGIEFLPIFIPHMVNKLLNKIMPLRLLIEYLLLKKVMKNVNADFWYYRSANTFLPNLVRIKNKIGGKLIFALSTDLQADKQALLLKYGKHYLDGFSKSLHLVDYFLFQKEKQKSNFLNQFGFSGKVIYNGHPLVNFAPIKKDKQLITWIGNLKKIKQPEIFFSIVKESNLQNVEFHMVGEMINEYSDEIQNLQMSCKQFYYHGTLPNEDVLSLIKKSSLLISTSYSEGFSNIFIEGWKFGVPIISFLNPDSIVSDFEVGYVCRSKDEMLFKIKSLLEDQYTYDNMVRNCKDLFEAKFSIEKNMSDLLALVSD